MRLNALVIDLAVLGPARRAGETPEGRLAAAATRLAYIWNQWFLNAIVRGDWDENLDGNLTSAGDRTADASLKGRVDYLGVNYYRSPEIAW